MTTSKKPEDLTVYGLVANDSFIQWVKEPNEALNTYWEQVIASNPDSRHDIEEATRLVRQLQFSVTSAPPSVKESVFEKIKEEAGFQQPHTPGIFSLRNLVKVAAVLSVVSLTAIWMYTRKDGATLVGTNASQLFHASATGLLFLSNGVIMDLDSINNGNVVDDGMSSLTKHRGRHLVYKTTFDPAAIRIDSLIAPIGQVWQLDLPDGSSAFINTGSTLRLAGHFDSARRGADVSGQVFFDVAPRSDEPFDVTLDAIQVAVLGTSFDVANYPDDPAVITLVQGSVSVKHEQGTIVRLTRQQQATYLPQSTEPQITFADTEQVTAWKNGMFAFRDNLIEDVMRPVARWYGVNVVYEGSKPDIRITGTIPKDSMLEEVLAILQDTNDHVRFEINGRTVVVREVE